MQKNIINKSTILITGINGFLGSYLAKSLFVDYNIIGLEYSLTNLYRIKGYNFKVFPGKMNILNEIFKEHHIDIIIHTATVYDRQVMNLNTTIKSNLFLPLVLLDKSIKNGCKCFVNTDTVLNRYTGGYALSKRHFQEWLYLQRSEIMGINMKLEHLYGPGSDKTNFVSYIIEQLKSNIPSLDLTAGEQKRDFVYIEDVVSAYKTVIEKMNELNEDYSEFQVSTNKPLSIKKMVKMLKKIIGSETHLNFGAIPYRENELMQSTSDNSALLSLGWSPKYTIKEGLKLSVLNS